MDNLFQLGNETLNKLLNMELKKYGDFIENFSSDKIILLFLTSDVLDDILITVLESTKDKMIKKIPLKEIKRVLLLNIISSVYLILNYLQKNNIETKDSIKIKQKIESLHNSSDLLFYYQNNPLELLNLIEVYNVHFKYLSPIKESKLIKSIENDTDVLFTINPLEIFRFLNSKDLSNFSKEEIYTQDFLDIFEITNNVMEAQESNDKLQDDFIYIFGLELKNKYNNNILKIYEFLMFMFSNLYQNVFLIKSKKIPSSFNVSDSDIEYLIQVFENNSLSELFKMFFNDENFLTIIIYDFYDFNYDIDKVQVIKRINLFKLYGNIDILNGINPYFEEDYNKITKKQ